MSKKPIESKPDYTIRRRFFDGNNNPLEWQDYGRGKFIDKTTIRKQFDLLRSSGKMVEIEFKLDKKILDEDCYEVKKPIIYYDKR
jgi:hypothetical protein